MPYVDTNGVLGSRCRETNFYELLRLPRWIGSWRIDGVPEILEAVDFAVVVMQNNNSVRRPMQTLSSQTRRVKQSICRIKMTTLALLDGVQIPVWFVCRSESFANEDRVELTIGRRSSLFFGPIHRMKGSAHPVSCVSRETGAHSKREADHYRRIPIQSHEAQFSAQLTATHHAGISLREAAIGWVRDGGRVAGESRDQ